MLEAMKIGSHLASSVIASCENVCPCFSQDKFDIVKNEQISCMMKDYVLSYFRT